MASCCSSRGLPGLVPAIAAMLCLYEQALAGVVQMRVERRANRMTEYGTSASLNGSSDFLKRRSIRRALRNAWMSDAMLPCRGTPES